MEPMPHPELPLYETLDGVNYYLPEANNIVELLFQWAIFLGM